MNVLNRTLVPLTAALAVSLAACSDDVGGGKDSTSSSSEAMPDAPSATEAADPTTALPPLAITDHVLTSLPGFSLQGQAEVEDLKAFAEAHEKSVAELRRSGFEVGSSAFFTGEGRDFAASVAVEYVDAAAAEVEAERLFASNTEGDPEIEVTPLDVPGVPGVKAASLDGADGGTRYAGVEIVFVGGAVLHELFAVGEAERFEVEAVVDAVTALYEEVAGHPTT